MQPPQIEYAPVTPSHKRLRLARRIVFGIVTVLVLWLAIKSAPSAWRHVQILYWQHRAMTYTAPADHVVYDDDPADAANLRKVNPSLITGSRGEVFEFAKPWDRFYQVASPPGHLPMATLFLHEMKNRSGESRLVVLEASPQLRFYKHGHGRLVGGFQFEVLKPGGLFSSPQHVIYSTPPEWFEGSVKLCEGQIDPKNPSHFTIQCTWNGTPVTIEGWLWNNDDVELSAPPSWR